MRLRAVQSAWEAMVVTGAHRGLALAGKGKSAALAKALLREAIAPLPSSSASGGGNSRCGGGGHAGGLKGTRTAAVSLRLRGWSAGMHGACGGGAGARRLTRAGRWRVEEATGGAATARLSRNTFAALFGLKGKVRGDEEGGEEEEENEEGGGRLGLYTSDTSEDEEESVYGEAEDVAVDVPVHIKGRAWSRHLRTLDHDEVRLNA